MYTMTTILQGRIVYGCRDNKSDGIGYAQGRKFDVEKATGKKALLLLLFLYRIFEETAYAT